MQNASIVTLRKRRHQLMRGLTYHHPLATLPKNGSDFGIFYPIMGHMCHMPVVEVDPKTGQVSFLDYVAVHDCGTMINPMTVDGHVKGGTAQGIGTAFYEQFQYVVSRLPHAASGRNAGKDSGWSSRDPLALYGIWRQGRR